MYLVSVDGLPLADGPVGRERHQPFLAREADESNRPNLEKSERVRVLDEEGRPFEVYDRLLCAVSEDVGATRGLRRVAEHIGRQVDQVVAGRYVDADRRQPPVWLGVVSRMGECRRPGRAERCRGITTGTSLRIVIADRAESCDVE